MFSNSIYSYIWKKCQHEASLPVRIQFFRVPVVFQMYHTYRVQVTTIKLQNLIQYNAAEYPLFSSTWYMTDTILTCLCRLSYELCSSPLKWLVSEIRLTKAHFSEAFGRRMLVLERWSLSRSWVEDYFYDSKINLTRVNSNSSMDRSVHHVTASMYSFDLIILIEISWGETRKK